MRENEDTKFQNMGGFPVYNSKTSKRLTQYPAKTRSSQCCQHSNQISTRLTKGYQSFNREPGFHQIGSFWQMTMAFRNNKNIFKRNLTQEGQCIIRGHDMVHLKLEMTNQATCHPWLLNQEVSPRAFCLKLNYNSLCATFRGTKTALPGTGWWRITMLFFPQGQWIHPRYHGDKFISKSQPSSVMQTIPGPGKSVLAVQVLPHCPTMLLTGRILENISCLF